MNENLVDKKYPHTITNDELQKKFCTQNIIVIDVREQDEYDSGHIPEAQSIPLNELEKGIAQLNKEDEIYVICRSGNRSDLAAKMLSQNKFKKVFNVVEGMKNWSGEVVTK